MKETPLMKQYNSIKAKYPDALVLFGIGDFYEIFGEDAIKVSEVLEIPLVLKDEGTEDELPLTGFSKNQLDSYLRKLVNNGNRVAICDQLEKPHIPVKQFKRNIK